ncbi:MerR family transcriptional regulator [Halopseudomonas sabulinigri]|uniref:MerR family transcriptional regulator n=2 Tax=Halopseudomonas sabulinigri TaxID=472181 RepID=A0ABP9ZTU6_9GAMM
MVVQLPRTCGNKLLVCDHTMINSVPGLALANETLYPIREVSRLSGVNSVTLRAWERRYGLLVPQRTDSGHRLYSMRDIERVKAIVSWIARGVPVSKVASIIDRQALPSLSVAPVAQTDSLADEQLQAAREQLIAAVARGDLLGLERVYGQLFARWPLTQLCNDILLPVWRQYRVQAKQGGASACWALLDGFLRGRLLQRIAFLQPDRASVLLVSLQPREEEVEVLLAALFLADADINIAYLSCLPAPEELLLMCDGGGHQALLLFSDRALEAGVLTRQLPRLNQQLECPVAALGACCELQAVELQQANISCLGLAQRSLTDSVQQLLAGRFDG